MIYGAGSMLLALALLVAPVAPLAAAPVHVSHSGTVVAIDAGRGVLILDEVGP